MITIIEKDLTKLATIHTESITKYFCQVNSIDEINESIEYAKRNKLKVKTIGNGTNILFTQEKYEDKLFLKLGQGFNYFTENDDFVEIGGAYSFMRAGKKLTNAGYADFIYMTLIPGSLGGGVRQNAGTTYEGEVKDAFISAELYDIENKEVIELNKNEMNFSYRNSILQDIPNKYIILSAKFLLRDKVDDVDNLKKLVVEKQHIKKEKEPNGFIFGSTFKSMNYKKKVWWYIDQVGLRGKMIGGAKFSEKHANWIVNYNNANANDILSLIYEAQNKVSDNFAINLKIEVDLI